MQKEAALPTSVDLVQPSFWKTGLHHLSAPVTGGILLGDVSMTENRYGGFSHPMTDGSPNLYRSGEGICVPRGDARTAGAFGGVTDLQHFGISWLPLRLCSGIPLWTAAFTCLQPA